MEFFQDVMILSQSSFVRLSAILSLQRESLYNLKPCGRGGVMDAYDCIMVGMFISSTDILDSNIKISGLLYGP